MKILSKSVKVIFVLLIILFITILFLLIIYLTPFPKKDLICVNIPSRFIITKPNVYETQGYNECAAYATAYVLRSFGKNVNGESIYNKMKYKLPFLGVVPSKGIIDTLKRYHIKATYYKGDINTLKMHVSKNIPVILYVGENIKWEHFITMVGYENSSSVIYVFDSLLDEDSNGEEPGNRTLTEDELLKIWDNGLPILNHTYIAVDE
jgi:ABC-type bacteriocin/lantibiotic exporter with double-glycine peptidase domain